MKRKAYQYRGGGENPGIITLSYAALYEVLTAMNHCMYGYVWHALSRVLALCTPLLCDHDTLLQPSRARCSRIFSRGGRVIPIAAACTLISALPTLNKQRLFCYYNTYDIILQTIVAFAAS